jgi:hypothetical protein
MIFAVGVRKENDKALYVKAKLLLTERFQFWDQLLLKFSLQSTDATNYLVTLL